MGRFSDLWASGKFIIKDKQTAENLEKQQAEQLFEQLSGELAVPDSTKAIFDNLKVRRGQETGRWLRDMAAQQPTEQQIAAASAAPAATAGSFDATVALIDTLFKEFGDLTFEFNKSAIGTDLLITMERPILSEKKTTEVWYRPVARTYQGRLITRKWALIVRGQEKKISIRMLPAGMLLAYTGGQVTDDEYPPFMEISHEDGDDWRIAGEVFPGASIPHLAKEILGDLIRLSSGHMSESELLSPSNEGPKLGENMAVGYQQQAPQPVQKAADRKIDAEGMDVHDACDMVDVVVERELKRLYAEATKVQPGSGTADHLRKEISAIEAFRSKVMEAFELYTHAKQGMPAAGKEQPEKVELLK